MYTKLTNVPYALKQYPQWVAWRYLESDKNGKRRKVPFSVKTNFNASTVNENHWATFDEVVNFVTTRNEEGADFGIGFVLTENDPFVCIDLDYTGDESIVKYQNKILQNFSNTYIEISPSNKGYHIWCIGSIPKAIKTKTCEIYNHSRFITFTGNSINSATIIDKTETLNTLAFEFSNVKLNDEDANPFKESLAIPRMADQKVIAYLKSSTKSNDLYHGLWQHHFDSQSEADLCLMGIIADVSRNVEQTIRIFKLSGLGKRAKANRKDYIENTVKMAFSGLQPLVEVNLDCLLKPKNEPVKSNEDNNTFIDIHNYINNMDDDTDDSIEIPRLASKILARGELPPFVEQIDFGIPQGIVLDIAKFLFAQSIRPMREPCIAAAMGLMSAICGRAYNVNGAGLNQYIIVLAQTGSGKDSLNKGISEIINSVSIQIPDAWNFLGTSDIVSETALIQYFEKVTPSFMVMYQDFGITLKGWIDKREGRNTMNIRKCLLNLYGESGRKGSIRPRRFADNSKNTGFIRSPSLTILADSTPERFYEALTDDVIEEGLIPRFSILEVQSKKRPKANPYANKVYVNSDLTANLVSLISNANTINKAAEHEPIDVPLTIEAQLMMDEFNDYCDTQIDGLTGSERQLWNRSHLKALKIAGLFAIGANMYAPQITKEHAKFAINWVKTETKKLHSVVTRGVTGRVEGNQAVQLDELVDAIKDILLSKDTRMSRDMVRDGVVPYRMLAGRLLRKPTFSCDKKGSSMAIKNTLKILIECGYITEVPKQEVFTRYNLVNGVFYRVINLQTLLREFYKA